MNTCPEKIKTFTLDNAKPVEQKLKNSRVTINDLVNTSGLFNTKV